MRYFFPEINLLQGGGEHLHTIYGRDTIFNSFKVIERNKDAKVISTSEVKKDFLKRFILLLRTYHVTVATYLKSLKFMKVALHDIA